MLDTSESKLKHESVVKKRTNKFQSLNLIERVIKHLMPTRRNFIRNNRKKTNIVDISVSRGSKALDVFQSRSEHREL